MRRNVRNITLVGFAALVLGGVAVAASGTFDSTPTDTVARESATGDAVAARRPRSPPSRTTRRSRAWRWRVRRVVLRPSLPAPHQRLPAGGESDAATQAPADDGAKIVKTADLTVSIAKGKFTGAFAEASPHRDRERRVRRQLVDVDDGLPRQPDPARRHERAADAGLGQPGSCRSAHHPRAGREVRRDAGRAVGSRRCRQRVDQRAGRERASSSTSGRASRA